MFSLKFLFIFRTIQDQINNNHVGVFSVLQLLLHFQINYSFVNVVIINYINIDTLKSVYL